MRPPSDMADFARLIGVPGDWPVAHVMLLLERHRGDLSGLFEAVAALKRVEA